MWSYITISLLVGYYVLVLGVAFGVVLDNRNPAKTLGYLLVLLFMPIIGLVVYYMFGQNLRKRKLFNRKKFFDNHNVLTWEAERKKLFEGAQAFASKLLGDRMKMVHLLESNARSVVTLKNEAELLFDGQNAFPRMFNDMRQAKHHLHIEFYIVDDDEIGKEFKALLIKKANEGVKVRFCYDGVGSRNLPRKYLKELERAGVEVRPFMRVFWPYLTSKVNFRNHRKIVIIDGLIGYFGGLNIADRYTNTQPNLKYWRDTHMRVYGEAVKYLQMQFMLNWKFVSKQTLPVDLDYFPEAEISETHMMQIVSSGPDTDWPSIMQAILTAINTAHTSILICTPYYIPNDEVQSALKIAALSGLRVELMIPKNGDSIITQSASMSYVKELLEAGVRVFMYKKGFMHAKTMVVDDFVASVGTTNMDNRSFDLNFEINAFCYDQELAKKLIEKFESDKALSEEMSLDRWEKRRRTKRIIESIARMFAPLL